LQTIENSTAIQKTEEAVLPPQMVTAPANKDMASRCF
jgi:hypothetical protein